jgi:hypothetical protein
LAIDGASEIRRGERLAELSAGEVIAICSTVRSYYRFLVTVVRLSSGCGGVCLKNGGVSSKLMFQSVNIREMAAAAFRRMKQRLRDLKPDG